MNLGSLELLVGLFMVATFVLLIAALLDLVRRPTDVWKASGHNQLVWALVVVFAGFIGPALYLMIARPALNAAAGRVHVDSTL